MRAYYGSYPHDDAEVEVVVERNALRNSGDVPWAEQVQITMVGQKLAATPAACRAALISLANAYAVHGQNWVLKDNSGNAVISLLNSATFSGVQVSKGPNLPTMSEGVFSNYFPYVIVLEATLVTNSSEALESFTERIKQTGGGSRYGYLEGVVGKAQRQRIREHTPYTYIQTGSAFGIYDTPAPPPPLWPNWLSEDPEIELVSPRRMGNRSTSYGTSWTYKFQSENGLSGRPHVWGYNYFG